MMGRGRGPRGGVGAGPSRSCCQLLAGLVTGRTPAADGWGGIDTPLPTNQLEGVQGIYVTLIPIKQLGATALC